MPTRSAHAQRMPESISVGEATRSLLHQSLQELPDGIWLRILPLGDTYDDMCYGTGVDWEYLLPLLMNAGLIYSIRRSTVNQYAIVPTQWKMLCETTEGERRNKLELGTLSRSGKRTYFICKGNPIFKSPCYQTKATEQGIFAFIEERLVNVGLRRRICEQVNVIQNQELERCFAEETEQQEQQENNEENNTNKANTVAAAANKANTVAVANNAAAAVAVATEGLAGELLLQDVHQAIEYALALDLDRRPRLNRKGTDVILVSTKKFRHEKTIK